MPSGAKKRKAARKKKEIEALSHNQSHNQQAQPRSAVSYTREKDELKHHDDKESEGEEVSSPASQDHPNHQHQFTDGEKKDVKEVEDSSHVQLSGEENKSIEENKHNAAAVEEAKVEESVLQIEKEPEPAGKLNGDNIIEESVKTQKESGNGVVSRSLNGESTVEFERESKLVEKVDASVEHVEPQKEHNDGMMLERRNDDCHVIDKTNVLVDSSPFGSSTEAINSFCEVLTHVPNLIPVGQVDSSVAEPGSDTVPEEKIGIDRNSPGDSLVTSNVVPGMNENGKKEVAVLDQNDMSSPVLAGLGLESRRDEAIILVGAASSALEAKNAVTQETEEKIMHFNERDEANIQAGDAARALEAQNTVTQETEEKLTHLHSAPKDEAKNYVNASNGADHLKDSEVRGCSDTQPLVASAIPPVQRTSWLSCCGLFEVFAGSSR